MCGAEKFLSTAQHKEGEEERFSSRLHVEHRAWRRAWSHDHETTTWAKSKNRMLNRLHHPGTPLFPAFLQGEHKSLKDKTTCPKSARGTSVGYHQEEVYMIWMHMLIRFQLHSHKEKCIVGKFLYGASIPWLSGGVKWWKRFNCQQNLNINS